MSSIQISAPLADPYPTHSVEGPGSMCAKSTSIFRRCRFLQVRPDRAKKVMWKRGQWGASVPSR